MSSAWWCAAAAVVAITSSCVPPLSAPGGAQDGSEPGRDRARSDGRQPDLAQVCGPVVNAHVEPLAYGYSVNVSWDPLPAGEVLEIAWRGEREGSVLVDGARGAHLVIGLTPGRIHLFRLTRRCAGSGRSAPLLLGPVTTGQALAFTLETTVPYVGSEDEVILFNCFQPLAGATEWSALAAVTRDGQVQWAWSSPDGKTVTDVDWVPERSSLVAGVWGTFTELGLDGGVRSTYSGLYHHDLDFTVLGFTGLYYRLNLDILTYWPRLTEGIAVIAPQSGQTIWDWHLDDHIDVDDYNPVDIQSLFLIGHDWTHANDLDYLPDRKQFVLNLRNLDRALFIDYPSGVVAARIGSGTGLCDGLWSHGHEIVWLELAADQLKGRFLMFDNGNYRSPPYSRAIEVAVDAAARTCEVVWQYRESPDFFADALGSAYRLASGDTLITDGTHGRILQVDLQGKKRWEVKAPACQIYQAKPVPRSFFQPALVGTDPQR